MAITPTGTNAALDKTAQIATKSIKDKTILAKDDFLKLLLVELQNQDPTQPMDSEKILSQTSQLATLESADNTNKALKELTSSLGNSQQFSTIAAIGKTADLGSNSIAHDKGKTSSFEVYFPNTIQNGTLDITDKSGTVVKTLNVAKNPAGVYQFTWDGSDKNGKPADGGVYNISASYTDQNGKSQKTKLGTYPIEAVRFNSGETLVKVGSNYVPLSNIKEVF